MSDALSMTDPSEKAMTPTRPAPAASQLHGGIGSSRFIGMHAMGAVFPVSAGVLLFGWRALGTLLLVSTSSATAMFIWRRIGSRGATLRWDHVLWLSVLLGMTLPAHLFTGFGALTLAYWPLLVAAGWILVIFVWLLGGIGSGRVHPILITHLLLFVFCHELLVPQQVLQRMHMGWGDLLDVASVDQSHSAPWSALENNPANDAFRSIPTSELLPAYTRGTENSSRAWTTLVALLRDRVPPLEDLIVGGHPSPIGTGSIIAVIMGGLFLLYRGLIDYRVPLLIVLSAAAAFILLPVPVFIKESGAIWSWLPMRDPRVGWEVGVTLMSYEIMSGPLVFMAFFLATSPAVRPIANRPRVIYALLAGVLTAVFQLYVSVSIGAYLALLAATIITPTFDKYFRPRTLV
jgi:electron transport complex protein RnfD